MRFYGFIDWASRMYVQRMALIGGGARVINTSGAQLLMSNVLISMHFCCRGQITLAPSHKLLLCAWDQAPMERMCLYQCMRCYRWFILMT